jgi:hypothetical protein
LTAAWYRAFAEGGDVGAFTREQADRYLASASGSSRRSWWVGSSQQQESSDVAARS